MTVSPIEGKFSSVLHVEDQKLFHSSAVYAASIHSLSIPFRLGMLGPAASSSNAIGAINVGEAVQMLSSHASQNMVCTLNVAMPAPSSIGISKLVNYFVYIYDPIKILPFL